MLHKFAFAFILINNLHAMHSDLQDGEAKCAKRLNACYGNIDNCDRSCAGQLKPTKQFTVYSEPGRLWRGEMREAIGRIDTSHTIADIIAMSLVATIRIDTCTRML